MKLSKDDQQRKNRLTAAQYEARRQGCTAVEGLVRMFHALYIRDEFAHFDFNALYFVPPHDWDIQALDEIAQEQADKQAAGEQRL
jgi:hypothetical protein